MSPAPDSFPEQISGEKEICIVDFHALAWQQRFLHAYQHHGTTNTLIT